MPIVTTRTLTVIQRMDYLTNCSIVSLTNSRNWCRRSPVSPRPWIAASRQPVSKSP